MNTSNKISNKKSTDPFDKLIFEKGLRASDVLINKKLNLLLVILNNGSILKNKVSDYPKLKSASQVQLEKWKLISKGVGISWEELDEDLSIKGMIKSTALNSALLALQGNEEAILS